MLGGEGIHIGQSRERVAPGNADTALWWLFSDKIEHGLTTPHRAQASDGEQPELMGWMYMDPARLQRL